MKMAKIKRRVKETVCPDCKDPLNWDNASMEDNNMIEIAAWCRACAVHHTVIIEGAQR
jgi:RNase P subunit RPR2